jgi:hypothetical protein
MLLLIGNEQVPHARKKCNYNYTTRKEEEQRKCMQER